MKPWMIAAVVVCAPSIAAAQKPAGELQVTMRGPASELYIRKRPPSPEAPILSQDPKKPRPTGDAM
jgi:hypothetical protein